MNIDVRFLASVWKDDSYSSSLHKLSCGDFSYKTLKDSKKEFEKVLDKATELDKDGIHLAIIELQSMIDELDEKSHYTY